MRPVFCGSFDYDTRQSELDRLFSKYGRVDRVDMKSDESFITLFNLDLNMLHMCPRVRGATCGFFFHPGWLAVLAALLPGVVLHYCHGLNTRTRDIEKHFEPFGKVLHVRIRRNFAFVQFDRLDEATKALECTHMSKILGRVVSVEYALRDDGEHSDGVTVHMAVLEAQFVAGVGQVQIMVVLGALFTINTMVHRTILKVDQTLKGHYSVTFPLNHSDSQ